RLTGWHKGEAKHVAKKLFSDWLQKRGTSGSSDMNKAIQQVRAFLQVHRSRFEVLGAKPHEKAVIRDRAGFVRNDPESGDLAYLIFPSVFRTEACKGYSDRTVLKELHARGFLKCTPPDLTIKPWLAGLGTRTRVYCLRAAILEGDE